MTLALKYLSAVLIISLSFVLCAEAQSSSGTIGGVGTGTIVGVIAGVVAGVAVVAIVAIHYSKKRTITGCVKPAAQNGMVMNDEKDKLVYTLSGETSGIKPGERMTLQGKKIKPNTGNPLGWEITKIRTDHGVCQP